MFLLQRVDQIDSSHHLRQPFGISVDMFGCRGQLRRHVLQIEQSRMNSLEEFARRCIVCRHTRHRLLDRFQLQQHAHLFIVQRITRRDNGLTNGVGIGQNALLGLDTSQLALAQTGGRQLLNLKTDPLLITSIALSLDTQRSQLTLSRL